MCAALELASPGVSSYLWLCVTTLLDEQIIPARNISIKTPLPPFPFELDVRIRAHAVHSYNEISNSSNLFGDNPA